MHLQTQLRPQQAPQVPVMDRAGTMSGVGVPGQRVVSVMDPDQAILQPASVGVLGLGMGLAQGQALVGDMALEVVPPVMAMELVDHMVAAAVEVEVEVEVHHQQLIQGIREFTASQHTQLGAFQGILVINKRERETNLISTFNPAFLNYACMCGV